MVNDDVSHSPLIWLSNNKLRLGCFFSVVRTKQWRFKYQPACSATAMNCFASTQGKITFKSVLPWLSLVHAAISSLKLRPSVWRAVFRASFSPFRLALKYGGLVMIASKDSVALNDCTVPSKSFISGHGLAAKLSRASLQAPESISMALTFASGALCFF